jgi:hypothetical protein
VDVRFLSKALLIGYSICTSHSQFYLLILGGNNGLHVEGSYLLFVQFVNASSCGTHTRAMCAKDAEFLNVAAVGTYSKR